MTTTYIDAMLLYASCRNEVKNVIYAHENEKKKNDKWTISAASFIVSL